MTPFEAAFIVMWAASWVICIAIVYLMFRRK